MHPGHTKQIIIRPNEIYNNLLFGFALSYISSQILSSAALIPTVSVGLNIGRVC